MSGKSIASSSILGRYGHIKSILHQDHLNGISVPIGLEYPVSVSQNWLNKTLSINDNQYLSGHAAYSEQLDHLVRSKGLKMLQIYRDPRAVLVSWAKYVVEEENSWYTFHDFFKAMDLRKRIRFLIQGGDINGIYYSSFREVIERSGGWINSDNVVVVKFEDLVGSKGGGSDEIQREAISKILKHVGKELQGNELDKVQTNLFGGTHTFRGGQIDGWIRDFDEKENLMIINELKGMEVMRYLGYQDFE